MNKKQAIRNRTTAPAYVGVTEIMSMYSIGRDTARKIGELSGATVKVGKLRLYNVEKVRSYFESLAE